MPSDAPIRPLARRLAGLALLGLLATGVPARADDSTAAGTPDAKTREAVVRVVEELRQEASKIRGLPWKQDVPADLLTREQLKQHLEKMIQDEFKPDEYARDKKILQRLGMIVGDEDPLEMEKAFLEQGIAGFYDPKTKRLYIIDGLSVEGQRPTILHELIHALEDQHYGLEKIQRAVEKDSDKLFAVKCMVEGSAERARKLYEQTHPEVARVSRKDQSKATNNEEMAKLAKITPAFLFVPSLLHYQTGPALVTRFVGSDYPGGMAKMYAGDAPTTQEQCLHPGRFVTANRDLPRTFTFPAKLAEAAGPGWKGLEDQPTGELDFLMWMNHWLGKNKGRLAAEDAQNGRMWSKEAAVAAEGWDGMRAQILEKDGVPTGLVLASAWDSHQDAAEAANAVEACLRAQFGEDFHAAAWADTDDRKGRQLDFSDRYGVGRIAVRDDVLLVLDGFPKATFGAVWALLEGVKFERDPKDSWSRATQPDLVAQAAWNGGVVGWNRPDEMWVADEAPGGFSRGDLSIRMTVEKGPVQLTFLKAMVEARRTMPKAKIDATALTELQVGSKGAIRLDFDDPGASPVTTNSLILVLAEGATLVVRASAPKDAWDRLSTDLDAAFDTLVWKDD